MAHYRVTCSDHNFVEEADTPRAVMFILRCLEGETGKMLQEDYRNILARVFTLPKPLPAPEEPYADFFGLGASSIMVERIE